MESCVELPTANGYINTSSVPVAIGQTIGYRCEDENKVMDTGLEIQLLCLSNGIFQMPPPPQGISFRFLSNSVFGTLTSANINHHLNFFEKVGQNAGKQSCAPMYRKLQKNPNWLVQV